MKQLIGAAGTLEKSVTANSRSYGLITDLDLPANTVPTLISKQTHAVDSAGFSFINIPQTYSHLMVNGVARCTVAAITSSWVVHINNDTGANYDIQQFIGQGAVASANDTAGLTNMSGGTVAGDTALAGSCGVMSMIFYNYTSATSKQVIMLTCAAWGTGAAERIVQCRVGMYHSGIAINALQFTLASANMKAGSSVELVGIP